MHVVARERADRQHEDVPLGRRRRTPGAGPDRHRARVVLQRQRHDPARPRRAARVPPYAEDGGEEAEIAGVYLIDADGSPCRIGMATATSSPITASRSGTISISPARSFARARSARNWSSIRASSPSRARSTIERDGATCLVARTSPPAKPRCATASRNIEHHHFKFESHRRPGDVHVHYFGACSLSFGDGRSARRRRRDAGSASKASAGRCAIRCSSTTRRARSNRHSQTRMTSHSCHSRASRFSASASWAPAWRAVSSAPAFRSPSTIAPRTRRRRSSPRRASRCLSARRGRRRGFIVSMVADESRLAACGSARTVRSAMSPGAILIESSTVTTGWIRELAAAPRTQKAECSMRR